MRKVKRAAAWAIPAALLAGYAGQVRADDNADEQKMRADEKMVLVDTIDVQSAKGIGAFDISFVDPKTGLYVLADRTNASVDFFNTRDNTFIKRVGGFKGVVLDPVTKLANNNLSGPDGVVIVGHKEVWAGDGDSTVKVINIASSSVVDTISTGGLFRCDEMAFDSDDHILAVANNADTPPFVTIIDTDTHKIVAKIVFDGTNGTPDATNTGIEQSQWSPETGLFYVSVPQIIPTDPTAGGVSVIDPATNKVTATFPVPKCSPAGLALGPNHQALIGCSASFGVTPNVVTQSQIIDIKTGKIVKTIPQVGGSDEVWFDSGSGHYYLAARNNTDNTGKVVPSLGTVDAKTNMFDGITPTSTSAHSVAADSKTRHVYVPIGFPAAGASDPTNPCPVVTKGCIAVFVPSAPDADGEDRGRDGDGR
jgi:YVTN family beta-propeller protein